MAKLRANPKVLDAEALGGWLARRKRYMKAGLSDKEAGSLAGKQGGAELARMSGDLPEVKRRKSKSDSSNGNPNGKRDRDPTAGRSEMERRMREDDDPFNEDFGPNEKKSKEDKQRERMEAKLIRDQEKADRSKVYQAIQGQGGLKTRDDLREEYAGIPNTFKRKDGLAGDQMAEYLGMYYPELGIESERDLIDYLAA